MINLNLEDGLPISPEEARRIIQRNTDTMGVYIDIERTLEYEADALFAVRPLQAELYGMVRGALPEFNPRSSDHLLAGAKYVGIPGSVCVNKARAKSFDAFVRSSILSSGTVSEDAMRYTELVENVAKLNKVVSGLLQYKRLPLVDALATNGHRMVVGHPLWTLQSTSRIGAKDPGIQILARDTSDLIVAPEGWRLVRADSSQIEPRITYSYFILDTLIRDLIMAYNDAYYGQIHYIYLSDEIRNNPANYIVDTNDEFTTPTISRKGRELRVIKKNPITDEMKNKRQSFKKITLMATYGSGLAGQDPDMSRRFDQCILNHPLRKQMEARVIEEVNRGVETFYGAFGTPVTPEENSTYTPGTRGWNEHVIRCGINNPIQTTASELMTVSVYHADKILRSVDNAHICFYKHDEGCFYVPDKESHIIPELAQCTAYNVKGWIPIPSDVEEGIKYPKGAHSVLL